ncbi:MAG: MurR/RpiR family transcriptional regulator [Lachnospiraceae bacterium]|nr:MurR/RpiR family transcriptional regulator [Lachnospiraceae bacterium]
MEQSFVLEIQAAYNQFTKAEKKVEDYVIGNQQKVLYMSITDLADACDVGDTSVYRFCRSMNLQGYQEFKMRLSLGQGTAQETDEMEKTHDLAETVMNLNIRALKDTYALLNKEDFEKALAMFSQAGRVYFFGIGDSLLTAQEACNKFLRVTNKVICITDSHMQAMAASTASQDDLFIIISYTGSTKDNILVAKLAKQSGAKVVCISHFRKSPLTAYADVTLLCGADVSPLDGGSMTVKVGQLYLTDLLYQEYYSRNYKVCRKNNEKTSSAVLDKLF